MAATNQIQSNQVFMHGSCNQPYRYGGRVGLFGHYLRSLRIILLLTCIKLGMISHKNSLITIFGHKHEIRYVYFWRLYYN